MIEPRQLEKLEVLVLEGLFVDTDDPFASLTKQCCDVLIVPRDLIEKADPGINWASAHVFARKALALPFREDEKDGVGVGAADVKEALLTVPLKRNVFDRPDGKYILIPLGHAD